MTREQAYNFGLALNAIQRFVPPYMYADIMGSPVAQMVREVIDGRLTCEVKPVEAAPALAASEANGG